MKVRQQLFKSSFISYNDFFQNNLLSERAEIVKPVQSPLLQVSMSTCKLFWEALFVAMSGLEIHTVHLHTRLLFRKLIYVNT